MWYINTMRFTELLKIMQLTGKWLKLEKNMMEVT